MAQKRVETCPECGGTCAISRKDPRVTACFDCKASFVPSELWEDPNFQAELVHFNKGKTPQADVIEAEVATFDPINQPEHEMSPVEFGEAVQNELNRRCPGGFFSSLLHEAQQAVFDRELERARAYGKRIIEEIDKWWQSKYRARQAPITFSTRGGSAILMRKLQLERVKKCVC